MNEFIDRINGMQDGDTVTLSVPIGGGQTVNIEGTVKVESNGKVTITASKAEVPFRDKTIPINDASITIDRGNGLSHGDTVNANFNGKIEIPSDLGGGSGEFKDTSMSINTSTNKLTVSNAPTIDALNIPGVGPLSSIDFNGERDIDSVAITNANEDQRNAEKPTTADNNKKDDKKTEPDQTPAPKEHRFWERSTGPNKEVDTRDYRAKSEGYDKLHDDTQIKVRESDYGATDNPDIHDQYMWHTHVTQLKGGYKPGEKVSLAENPYLDKIYEGNKKNGLLLFAEKDKKDFSRFDFIAQYAATGQYNVEDLIKTADALEKQGLVDFAAHSHADYWSDAFEKILNDVKSDDYNQLAAQLQSDVEQLEKDFTKVHEQMTEWAGKANDSVREAIECILGKFDCTMGNIKSVLGPACEKIEEFKENLEKLKAGKEELTGEDGNGGLDKELKDLQLELEEKTRNLESIQSSRPAETITVQDPATGGNDSQPTSHQEPNPAFAEWQNNVAAATAEVEEAQRKVTEKEEVIKAKEEELDKLLEEILKTYFLIKNLTTTVQSFKQYFTAGTPQSTWISSPDNIVKFHDMIVDEFEDFTKMPVITALSGYYDDKGKFHDYEVGDVVLHDDAHGYMYRITQAFDPITGTIKIACYDDQGKKIGEDLTIWDPREIVPPQWVEPFHPYPIPQPSPSPRPVKPKPSPSPKPPGPQPSPSPKPSPTPKPTTPPPATTPQPTPIPTTPPPGTTPPPPVPTTAPFYPEYPTPPVPPAPPPIYPPHTGLDSVYANTADSSESGAGLGALAALLAGAAGLGVTELVDKKKEKDKEKEEKSESTEETEQQ